MDALKSAGRAIIRSPSLAKQSWGVGKHKKLPENWTDTRETLLEGMVFRLKYLGMTLVEEAKGEELSAMAVKRIMATAKASGKKLQKVTLNISPRGIVLYDSLSNQLIENISIYRISYCAADKNHDRVFTYIAQSQQNETLACHAYLCPKRKVAQAVTLTVAQAFRVAFEFWQVAKEGVLGCRGNEKCCCLGNGLGILQFEGARTPSSFFGCVCVKIYMRVLSLNQIFTFHSQELDDGLDEAFSRLAESRTNPQVLDIGVISDDLHADTLQWSPSGWDASDGNDLFGL
uniref:Low density lipoprotein receptor adaptor protein 1b n=1 Tax=Paramormyrops kingsleyae TaxID=1676925 RepID=A0A3B3S0W9_9TELE